MKDSNKMICRICLMATVAISLLNSFSTSAQNLSMSTNVASWAELGTINADMSYSVDRHWSVGVGAEFNPFTYSRPSGYVIRNRQQAYAVGTRFWPWHVYSGWFFGSKLQYQEYSNVGIRSVESHEGDRVGTGLSAGYAKMLGSHLNMELGLGAWMGHESFKTYSCATCGSLTDKGEKVFFLPDGVIMSFAYIF